MTETAATDQALERSFGGWSAAKLLGLLLLVPAGTMLAVSYVIPTISTIQTSLDAEDSYTRLLDGGYADTFGFAASVMVWPAVTVSIVALVVAYLANRAGRFARWLLRLTLVLPMVALAPTAFAVAWRLDRIEAGEPATDAAAQSLVRGAVGFTMFGLLVGVGVTVYLATFRNREQTRPGGAALVVGILAVLATLAVGLQLYTYPTVFARDGAAATTPLTTVFEYGLARDDPGAAAAAASMLLAALAALGILAVLLAIATRLRIEIPPPVRREPSLSEVVDEFEGTKAAARRPEAVFFTFLALVAVVAVTGYGLWPWLTRLLEFRAEDAGEVLVNTWLPPLVGAVIGTVAAALAGFAIGALRPLGPVSPLLLILVAPWLFVGNGVLSMYERDRYGEAGDFLSHVPPGWVVVPAVVVFTLLFRGQQGRWQELRAAGQGPGAATARALVLPALPMFWLVGAVTWLVQAQSLSWQHASADDADDNRPVTGPATVAADPEQAVGLVLPFVVILAFGAGLALLQLTYLDRLAVRAGRRGTGTV